ncbi:hypothetical protein TeGR_g3063 [Tetraparma gracilis]|uniref:Uncharacterized protein n=1 Tax=Tetraparma gracilis TaxID=2962635 RepID=A0ABQ6MKY7_9STRA|nr:hypothetical protein TeGR_g3063 [Tetraparma gracilis]
MSSFSDYFIPLAAVSNNLQTTSPIVAFKILAFKSKSAAQGKKSRKKAGPDAAGRAINILAVATADSQLNFYEADGTHLLSYPATHVVSDLAFDCGNGDLPLLVTGGRDGTVLFHNLTLWRNTQVISGRKPKPTLIEGQ